MTKPFEKTTNFGIEISSKPPIQTMPTPIDNLMANQSKQESNLDPKQEISAPLNTNMKNKDLGFFKDEINPDLLEPSGNPFPSSYKKTTSQSNTYRGFNRS